MRRQAAHGEPPGRTAAPKGAGRQWEASRPANALWERLARAAGPLQAKLRVGAVDDPLEREADRVADAVVSGPVSGSMPGSAAGTVQRKCAACEEEEMLQTRRSAGPAGSAPEVSPKTASSIASFRGGGEALSPAARGYFEPRFGRDLSAVRLHTGGEAATAAGEIQARAFTVGSDIAFAAGEYRPDSVEGKRLLTHELTHTVQQGAVGLVQRLPEGEIETLDLRSRVRALENQQLIELLEDLYRRAGAAGRGRTGSGTQADPFEDYAFQLRQSARTESALGSLTAGTIPASGPGSLVAQYSLEALGARRGLLESDEETAARVLPIVEAEARSRLRAQERAFEESGLFVRGNPESWSRALRADAAGPALASRQLAIERVRDRLGSVVVPTRSGQLSRHGGDGGFVYTSGSEGADEHRSFAFRGDETLGLSSPAERRRWEIFEFVMATEGDTAAINAWDSQLVTIGAGFSAVSGQAQALFNRMPEEFRQRLFEHGIEVNPDNTFTVLDLDSGVVAEGNAASRILQTDERRLSLLIGLAQSEETMTMGGDSRTVREWMLRAQFEQLTSLVPEDVLDRWNLAAAKLAVKMHHWQPSVATWPALRTWSRSGADVHAMARGARDAIWRFHGHPTTEDFSLDAIEGRFQSRADRLRLGRLRFTPRPTR